MTNDALLLSLLVIPVALALVAWLARRPRWVEAIAITGAGAMLVISLGILVRVVQTGAFQAVRGYFYVDALSALLCATIAVVGFGATLASVPYLRHDLEIGHVPGDEDGWRWYFAGLLVFLWTMLLTVTVDSLGLLWVGLEATTLISALLVGFYRTRLALEAAWKYLMLCTVGITCALFGVLLTYYAAREGGGSTSMDWTRLVEQAPTLDPAIMRLAFVFVIVGFGAKAGFAPLHTWLADAHSQAPSPISGLLSAVLLACALYGILRFQTITAAATGGAFASRLLLAFGVLSILVAAPFILAQRDLKRLFAYSSVEHMGLMAVAFGIGGPAGVAAGMLHMMNHAATKAVLFFVSGDLVQRYGSRRISAIRGALRVAPGITWLLIIGVFALSGSPPFGVFTSEMLLFDAGFRGDWSSVAAVTIAVLAVGAIFAGLLGQALRIAYGPLPSAVPGSDGKAPHLRPSLLLAVALAPLLLVMVLFGLYVPTEIRELVENVYVALNPADPGLAEVARGNP